MKKIISCALFCMLVSLISCGDEETTSDSLTVSTTAPTNITASTAILGGSVTQVGTSAVTSRGVCISADVNPTINDANDVHFEIGTGIGSFTETFTGFVASTLYHVRAYATTSTGTVYGEDKTFTTLAASATTLSVTTATPSNITATSVTLGGNVPTDGGSTVTEKGICISADLNPTITDPNDAHFEIGTGVGAFTETFTGLVGSTTYHVRAYAINSSGTAYGEDKSFTTLAAATSGCPIVNVNTNNMSLTISSPTTWETGKVYVVTGDVTVTSTLTIQPGVVVKFKGTRLSVNSSGKILATGTSTNRIVFTSISDDTYCGDTNGDGTTTTPAKGDWTSVYLNGGNGNTFKYCDFLYAGKNDGSYNNCILISTAGSSFEFDNCTFAHTLSATNSNAYVFHGGAYMEDNSVSKFTNNAFYDNDRPIYTSIYYNHSTTNIFHNPTNVNEKNKRNGIWLYNTTNQGATLTFSVTEVPYVIPSFFNGGGSGATDIININANVILKFADTSAGISRSFSRSVTLNASAILTSLKDDARGGDTNGDGNASVPAAGDWDGYYNYQTTTYITGANIFYAAH